MTEATAAASIARPTHLLDNPAWHALGTTHREFGLSNALACRYQPDVSPIAAVADARDPACWQALGDLIGTSTVGIFGLGKEPLPAGWEADWRYSFSQMICTKDTLQASSRADVPPGLRQLGIDDAPAMVALAQLTRPGPMEARTVTLGHYLGVFDDEGALVAMAGERMRLDGFVEVSGVCTHPEHRGNGYAEVLVTRIARAIVDEGKTAFLHVREDNRAAQVYRRLGFTVRAGFDIASVKKARG
jgi:GNAT superfamily N-acetyltransferase